MKQSSYFYLSQSALLQNSTTLSRSMSGAVTFFCEYSIAPGRDFISYVVEV